MKVILKSAEYTDFRGIRHELLNFEPGENLIHLPNKAGKTSRADGFSWVMFGKNSEGKDRFTVESNNTKNKPKTNVSLVLDVDGKEIKISKSPGKWVYDGLEVKKNVFEDFLSQIKSIETMWLLSNPYAFMNLHWEVRRNILTKLFSEKIPEDSEFSFLMKSMAISDIRKTKTQAKKIASDGLERCKIIIETHEKSIKEVFNIDFLKLKKELLVKTAELEKLSNFNWENYYNQKTKLDGILKDHASLVHIWNESDKNVKSLEESTHENSKGCAQCGTKVSLEKFNELKKSRLILLKTKRENAQNDIIKNREVVSTAKKNFESLDQTKPDETTTAIIAALKQGINVLNIEIAKENNIVTINKKIAEEQTRLDGFTSDIMAIESFIDRFKEFLTNNYYKSINDNFEGLFFDIEDECKCTNPEGTEFKDFSLSEKINAGVQIVSVLSKKIDLQFPIWIDNRESVTDLYPIDTQIINLKVKE